MTVSKSASSTPELRCPLRRDVGVEGQHAHAESLARRCGQRGRRCDPAPTSPSVFPISSVPIGSPLGAKSPAASCSIPGLTCLATASIRAIVCSAVDSVGPSGVLQKTTRWRVAASRSTLSMPIPVRTRMRRLGNPVKDVVVVADGGGGQNCLGRPGAADRVSRVSDQACDRLGKLERASESWGASLQMCVNLEVFTDSAPNRG